MSCFASNVSNSAIFFVLPKPVKNALALVERFEPSMMYNPEIGNSHFFAMTSMALRNSPSGIGSNLLNSGRITAGASHIMTN